MVYFINIDLSRTFAIILLREASDDASFLIFDFDFDFCKFPDRSIGGSCP